MICKSNNNSYQAATVFFLWFSLKRPAPQCRLVANFNSLMSRDSKFSLGNHPIPATFMLNSSADSTVTGFFPLNVTLFRGKLPLCNTNSSCSALSRALLILFSCPFEQFHLLLDSLLRIVLN